MGAKQTVMWSGLMSDGTSVTTNAQKFSFTYEMQGGCTAAVLCFTFPWQQRWSIHLCICFHFWNIKCEFFHSFANFFYLQVERKEGQEGQESLGGWRPGLLCVTSPPDLELQDCVPAFIWLPQLLIMGHFHKLMMQLVEMGFLYAK